MCVGVVGVGVGGGGVFFIRKATIFQNMCEKWWWSKAALPTSKVSASTQTKRSKTIRRGGIGEMNNSEERGRWVDGRERSRVKDSVSLWQGGGREDASETLVLTVL